MSDEIPPRKQSDLTIPIPREALAPVSTPPGPMLEQLEEIAKARRASQADIETLVSCPGPCTACPCCFGEHMVSPERAAVWRRSQLPPPPPDDEEPR